MLPVFDLSAPGQDAGSPQVAIAPDGATPMVWYRYDGSNRNIQAVSTQGPPKCWNATLKTGRLTRVRRNGTGGLKVKTGTAGRITLKGTAQVRKTARKLSETGLLTWTASPTRDFHRMGPAIPDWAFS